MADSDNSAGVGLPTSLTIEDALSNPIGTFSVTNPAGSETTVPVTISGLNFDSTGARVTINRAHQWTMFTEASFIPEPQTTALGVAGLALGVAGLRRWRQKDR